MNQEPLGRLLLRRGLITADQLTAALADQRTTGEPLGKIVVARGFAAAATIAQALATQHGGLLKTEYGFATGFDSGGQPMSYAPPPVTPANAPHPAAAARVAVAGAVAVEEPRIEEPRFVDHEADRETVREELSAAAAAAETLRNDNARLVELRSQLEQRLATETRRAASLERELAERDAAIAELVSEREELAAVRAATWADADRHLLFFQGTEGYELIERDGPPPSPGSSVELDGGTHVVARIAASPTPGLRVPCAYLVAA